MAWLRRNAPYQYSAPPASLPLLTQAVPNCSRELRTHFGALTALFIHTYLKALLQLLYYSILNVAPPDIFRSLVT